MIFIHHGRGVEQGLAEVLEDKYLIVEPISDLKVASVKHLVELYSQVYPYKNPCLVAGPLDEADPSTLDILLKRIEEPIRNAPELILWARDLGGVPDTIRSRCGEKYHYAPPQEHEKYEEGLIVFKALKEGDLGKVLSVLKDLKAGDERGLLEAFVEAILASNEYELYSEPLKRLVSRTRISKASLYGFFLGLGEGCFNE